jgi:putative membrane protein
MIKNFRDHAANERTYLAWVRSAIAIMTLGFFIEKFDFFVAYMGQKSGDSEVLHHSVVAEYLGIGLFFISVVMVLVASYRFFRLKNFIDAEEVSTYNIQKINYLLPIMMVFLGLFFAFYVGHLITR